jgi:hypothetical protein
MDVSSYAKFNVSTSRIGRRVRVVVCADVIVYSTASGCREVSVRLLSGC